MNPSLPVDLARELDDLRRRLGELETARRLPASAAGGGGTAFAPRTLLRPVFVDGVYTTETLFVDPSSGWVDLAVSQQWPTWQETVEVFAYMSNGSPGETVEVRLWDQAAAAVIDGPRELIVDGTPQAETLDGPIPYTPAAPGGTARNFAVQVRTTSAASAGVVFEWGPGLFEFEIV